MLDIFSKLLGSCPWLEKDERGEVDWLSPRNIIVLAGTVTGIIVLVMVFRALRRHH